MSPKFCKILTCYVIQSCLLKKIDVKLVSAIFLKLQQQTMSTCVGTPRKTKLYVAMVDASSIFTASG